MLRVDKVQVRYGDFLAVSSVSMALEKGEMSALIGGNGAGKSSLLQAISGLHSPCAGHIWFENEEITGLPAEKVVQRGLCLVPQGGRCFQRMTVEENLLLGAYPSAARRNIGKGLESVYSLFPVLKEKRKAAAGTLSGGQRQMVAIGRALMSQPRCLMFDEISLGLAPVVIRDLYACIVRLNREKGLTVLLVEQDMERVLKVADTCHFMLKGSITASERPENLNKERIRSLYFGV